jgi:hypothetical protein
VNYATWNLKFEGNYGTGPEQRITELGHHADGAWANAPVSDGGTIMGYLNAEIDPTELAEWNFQNLTQAEALAFCQTIRPDAYLDTDGKIVAPEVA